MKDYQQRVIDEKAQLDERIAKLDAFTGTNTYRSLDGMEQLRLRRQCSAMLHYSDILAERIAAFKEQQ